MRPSGSLAIVSSRATSDVDERSKPRSAHAESTRMSAFCCLAIFRMRASWTTKKGTASVAPLISDGGIEAASIVTHVTEFGLSPDNRSNTGHRIWWLLPGEIAPPRAVRLRDVVETDHRSGLLLLGQQVVGVQLVERHLALQLEVLSAV